MPSWILQTDHVELEGELLPPPGDAPGAAAARTTFTHHFEPKHVHAVNAALAAGRALLVRGEPGVGKSQLARAAAKALGRAFVARVIDARTESQDLLWSFDAVRRLADAQILGAEGLREGESVRERLDDRRYVHPGPLWWGFAWDDAKTQAERAGAPRPIEVEGADPSRGVVVLLDEIDKADSSVPTGCSSASATGSPSPPAVGHRPEQLPIGTIRVVGNSCHLRLAPEIRRRRSHRPQPRNRAPFQQRTWQRSPFRTNELPLQFPVHQG